MHEMIAEKLERAGVWHFVDRGSLEADIVSAAAAFLELEGVDPAVATYQIVHGVLEARWPGCGDTHGAMVLVADRRR